MITSPAPIHRILIIDDNPAIHDDFRKILTPDSVVAGQLGSTAAALFGRQVPRTFAPEFEIDCAFRGQDGLEKVRAAAREGRQYSMAYVDVRMPNGWDGIETISRIWQEFGDLQVVICTAFSDHSWEEIQERLGQSDRFLILKKPFDNLEVRQLTFALAERARSERELDRSQRELAAEGVTVRRLGSDITELKRIEEELRKARDEAERASRAKSEFLSRVSHELRTPMNAILGFAQLLEMDESLGREPQAHISEILRGGRHLLGLINNVLDLSDIESGRVTLSLEAVAVQDVIDEAAVLLRPLAESRGILVRIEPLPGPGWHVLADRQRLKQVLLNLLSNAILYNVPNGAVTMHCAAGDADNPETLRLGVRDTGPGLSAEKRARLFTPFDRLDAERTHTHIEGAGLGLCRSRRMVEVMGGALSVETAPGSGSTFWVELARAESPAARQPAILSSGPQPENGRMPARTLVYIEDNLSNLKLIERILAQRPGIRLLAAMQGQTGFDLVREHSPDLVLLDLNLPDLGGHEVLSRMRQTAATSAIPVVIISADSSPGQVERLLAAGAHAFLTKPLDIAGFLRVVDQVLENRDAFTLETVTP
jgi:signal transduction histidine kinase